MKAIKEIKMIKLLFKNQKVQQQQRRRSSKFSSSPLRITGLFMDIYNPNIIQI